MAENFNLMKVKDAKIVKVPNETIVGGGIVTIVGMKKARTIYTDDEMTLESCLYKARKMEPENKGIIFVIDEHAFGGRVYRYGNHGYFWELVGHMKGWA